MNPTEIYEFLKKLADDGPAMLIAWIIGVVMGAVVYRIVLHQGEKKQEDKIRSLEQEGVRLQAELVRAREGETQTRVTLAEEQGNHRVTTGKLASAEQKIQQYSTGLKSLNTEKINLTAQVDTLKRNQQPLEIEAAKVAPLEQKLREQSQELALAKDNLEQVETRRRQLDANARNLRAERRELEQQLQTATEKLPQLEHERDAAMVAAGDWERKYRVVAVQLDKAREAHDAAVRKAHETIIACESKDEEINRLNADLAPLQGEITRLRQQIADYEDHLTQIRAQEGRIWERPLAAGATRFVPMSERKCRIISLLNLKGGVGKTTLTLNIGATLAEMGKRVLLIDLDQQRSLGMLCLSAQRRLELQQQERMLQQYLIRPDRTPMHFYQLCSPVPNVVGCSIITNSQPNSGLGLAEIETQLLVDWIVRHDGNDLRLILRESLHSQLIDQHFDYILIDCPPRINPCCINALAATDFVLIPINLDGAAPHAVPNLMGELRRLRSPNLFPNINILGVVANRAPMNPQGKVVSTYQSIWQDDLPSLAKAGWGEKIYQFKQVIHNKNTIGIVASDLQDLGTHNIAVHQNNDVAEMFRNLVDEMIGRIKYVSPKLAGVSS